MSLYQAVMQMQLANLKYTVEHGYPWHPETTSQATKYGHLAILKYAHQNSPLMCSHDKCINLINVDNKKNKQLNCYLCRHSMKEDISATISKC